MSRSKSRIASSKIEKEEITWWFFNPFGRAKVCNFGETHAFLLPSVCPCLISTVTFGSVLAKIFGSAAEKEKRAKFRFNFHSVWSLGVRKSGLMIHNFKRLFIWPSWSCQKGKQGSHFVTCCIFLPHQSSSFSRERILITIGAEMPRFRRRASNFPAFFFFPT